MIRRRTHSIRVEMLALFAAILAMLTVAGAIVERGHSDLVGGARDAVWEASTPPAQVFTVASAQWTIREHLGAAVAGAPLDRALLTRLDSEAQRVWGELTALAPFFPAPIKAEIDRTGAVIAAYRAAAARTGDLLTAGDRATAQAQHGGTEAQAFAPVGPQVARLLEVMRSRIAEVNARMEATAAASAQRLLAVGAVVLVLLVASGVVIHVRLLRPLNAVNEAIGGLSRGVFGQRLPADSSVREIADIATSSVALEHALVERDRLESERERARAAEVTRARAVADAARSVQAVVASASQGDFSQRAHAERGLGELEQIVDGLNRVCETTGQFLDALGRRARGLAGGDLSERMPVAFAGRFGAVASDLDRSVVDLGATIADVKAASQVTAQHAHAIRAVAEELGRCSHSQAATIEQLGTAVDEFSAGVAATADAAQELATAMGAASRQADAGSGLASDALAAMATIEASSQRVGEAVDLINSVAFQTNLLALNASVEAARAGEHGKGFAVVATEVRRLAVQVAEAAQSVRAIVANTREQMTESSDKVRQAATALTDIAGSVQAMTGVVTEIAGAAREQASTVTEIKSAVGSLDLVKQRNSDASDRNASAADELMAAATELAARMERFRTEAASAGPRRAA
jgi:methyl-accepting chemotaxis protein